MKKFHWLWALTLFFVCPSRKLCAFASYPEFSYRDHPTYTLLGEDPSPVIMSKYFFRSNFEGRTSSENGMFAPKLATYKIRDTEDYFCQNADVLYTPLLAMNANYNAEHFATVQLTGPARVFVVLTKKRGTGQMGTLSDITSTNPGGVPSNWFGPVYPLEHETGRSFRLGDRNRWADATTRIPYLSPHAVAVEATLDENYMLQLPHPRSLRYRNFQVRNLLVIIAPVGSSLPLGPHPNPALPGDFESFLNPGEIVSPGSEPPVPNQSCPQWLHDMYVVQDNGFYEGRFWKTWHPPIDPVYWCYFDHEHGGYPGHYRPKFHYTAYHTPDPSTHDGRQDESHNGFKVIPFFADDGRIVIMMLHAHNSNPRRFLARHHTFLLSVHSADWELEMELYMKADFGPLRAINTGIFLSDQQEIEDEMRRTTGQVAERDTNLLDPDDLPNNNGMWWNGENDIDAPRSPFSGRYEEWRFGLNCAKDPIAWRKSGFKFEFHKVQTAMKRPIADASYDNQTPLNGDGMQRSIVFVEGGPDDHSHRITEVAPDYCVFGGLEGAPTRNNGLFYTDPYFTEVIDDPSNWFLYLPLDPIPQFIKEGFEKIDIGGHRAVTNEDPWVGISSYDEDMRRGFSNMEFAIKVMEN